MVRTPGHYKVGTGIDTADNIYTFNNPITHATRGVEETHFDKFETKWSGNDIGHVRNTSHLMLVVYPKDFRSKGKGI